MLELRRDNDKDPGHIREACVGVLGVREVGMNHNSATLENALESLLRRVVREEIRAALGNSQKNDQAKKPYLTIKEAAEFSRLAPSTIRLYIRQRKLRALKEGRRVIIKGSGLEKFLEATPIEIVPD
jgi:excisionase family DNA binding protein